MKLTRFRVQNYKKVEDTGWISCDNLTLFVGKNEAGKSTIFRGLSKLNPSDGEKYDGLKEFPRRRYTKEFKLRDYPVASVEFELAETEKVELKKIWPNLKDLKKICCTRYYSWKLEMKFETDPDLHKITNNAYIKTLEFLLSQVKELIAPEGKGEELKPIKTNLIEKITQEKESLTKKPQDQYVTQKQIDGLINAFSTLSNEKWQKDILTPLIDKLQSVKISLQIKEWVEKNIPKFIYFDRYDVIDSAIHITDFASKIKNTPFAPRVRATKCLFEHVGLDIKTLINLDPNNPEQSEQALRKMADERAILMSSASTTMTGKFSDWWDQRKHKFRYQIDGSFFRVWVSDDLDPSDIELDQRSLGLQYFFSFYIVFLVEAKGVHRNAILLLDEPGLHMHCTAQAKIVKFMEKLSEETQTLYTTHSPFMIDGDHLGRIRVVSESEDGTTIVSEEVWPRDREALFPLQAALGYSIVQTLFYAKRQVIVEGITDYAIFKLINQLLLEKKMTGLREDVVIIPAGGVSHLIPLASMLLGHNIEISAILDGDEPARRKGKTLQDKLVTGEQGRVVFIGDYFDNKEAEMEDIFPEDFYLEAVKESYNGLKLRFNNEEKDIPNITKRVSHAFERLGKGKFEKWRPAKIIQDRIEDNKDIPKEVLETFSKIFQDTNKLFQ